MRAAIAIFNGLDVLQTGVRPAHRTAHQAITAAVDVAHIARPLMFGADGLRAGPAFKPAVLTDRALAYIAGDQAAFQTQH